MRQENWLNSRLGGEGNTVPQGLNAKKLKKKKKNDRWGSLADGKKEQRKKKNRIAKVRF